MEGRVLENDNHYKNLETLLWKAYRKERTEAELKKDEVDVLRDTRTDKTNSSYHVTGIVGNQLTPTSSFLQKKIYWKMNYFIQYFKIHNLY